MKIFDTKKLATTAMLFAIGMVLPFLIGQIPQIGKMLCPLHIPVLLCGLICGWKYGLAVGFLLPLTRSVLFGTPVIYPNAVAMAFELATYGAVSGVVYYMKDWRCLRAVYRSMIIAMVSGRIVWGIMEVVLLGFIGKGFTMQAFIAGALVNAIPGIILQLILIPAIMVALNKAKLVRFSSAEYIET